MGEWRSICLRTGRSELLLMMPGRDVVLGDKTEQKLQWQRQDALRFLNVEKVGVDIDVSDARY